MANKPVIGYQVCPHCGGKVPVIWDGNRKETCMHCKKRFLVKRQKLRNTMRIKRPPDGVRGGGGYMLEPTKHKELGSDTRPREMRKESRE